MFKSILVAVDGSGDSDRAVHAAVEMAGAHEAEFHICHVFHIPHHYVSDLAEGLRSAIRKDGEDTLAHAARIAQSAGVEASTHLVSEGHPAEAVVALAEELGVDLIVVGVRGKSPDRTRALGSVSGAVAQHAHTSVLLVRRPH
jgi:nucleotide-binding universal stress UspA family protein